MSRFLILLIMVVFPGNLWGQGAPKKLWEPATIGPYLLMDPQTKEISVRWHVYPPMASVLEYGETPDLGTTIISPMTASAHQLSLPVLPGGKTLYYKVQGAQDWSRVYDVSLGALDKDQLNILLLADMQDAGVLQPARRWKEVADAALLKAREIKASFLLIPGDMTEDDHLGYWKSYFDKGQELLARYPSITVPGNHDSPAGQARGRDYTNYQNFFPGSLYFGFEAGPGAFLMLNTEATALGNFEDDLDQVKFTQNYLSKVQETPWVLALFHYPPYHALNRHQVANELTRGFTPFFEGMVDWVFTGHVHAYQRTFPVNFPGVQAPAGYGRSAGKGVGYVVLPPAGNWPEPYSRMDASSLEGTLMAYPVREDEIKFKKTLSELGFLSLQLEKTRMSFEVWGMGDLSQNREASIHLIEKVVTEK